MRAFYNEIDRYCCDWLQNLMDAGLITPGKIDDRSITELTPDDVSGYRRCHFFAGLGGWERALHLAGWPDDRPVWTASPPCQPFSTAGSHSGHGDERHLWPALSTLTRERKPAVIFGEQVARAIGMGWLDAVAADLETQAYSFGAAVLPACSVGAPHIRNRVWFVAHADTGRWQSKRLSQHGEQQSPLWDFANGRSAPGRGHGTHVAQSRGSGLPLWSGTQTQRSHAATARSGWWATEPNVGRVANGVSARVGKLRALGNAIVPELAAEFIRATMT